MLLHLASRNAEGRSVLLALFVFDSGAVPAVVVLGPLMKGILFIGRLRLSVCFLVSSAEDGGTHVMEYTGQLVLPSG